MATKISTNTTTGPRPQYFEEKRKGEMNELKK